MNISLDYDDTYTKDKRMWNNIIELMKNAGHRVYVVTMRSDEFQDEWLDVLTDLEFLVDGVYFTAGKQKRKFMEDLNIFIDVWIDDMPEAIVNSNYLFE